MRRCACKSQILVFDVILILISLHARCKIQNHIATFGGATTISAIREKYVILYYVIPQRTETEPEPNNATNTNLSTQVPIKRDIACPITGIIDKVANRLTNN